MAIGYAESRSLGYAHWPELATLCEDRRDESRSLGYAHWPEQLDPALFKAVSLDHWDMRTGRNKVALKDVSRGSLDHWDMRTGRN